jgi:hypothetical protein
MLWYRHALASSCTGIWPKLDTGVEAVRWRDVGQASGITRALRRRYAAEFEGVHCCRGTISELQLLKRSWLPAREHAHRPIFDGLLSINSRCEEGHEYVMHTPVHTPV